jgi:hypothetical protein
VAPADAAAHYLIVSSRSSVLLVAFLLSGCSIVREPPDPYFGRPEIPVSPGENFLVLSGGACLGACPHYEIFVFESGRVVFNGIEHTARSGVVERHTMPAVYFDLRKLLTVRGAFSSRLRLGCRTDHPAFLVASVKGDRTRVGRLDSGCFTHTRDLDAIRSAFIRAADAQPLIGS